MNLQDPLEILRSHFAAWRTTRPTGQKTPAALRQQAVDLKTHYPVSQIISALGINNQALKRWSSVPEQMAAPGFIPLPSQEPSPETVLDATPCSESVICKLPNGVSFCINRDKLDHDFLAMLCALNPGVSS